MGMLSLLDSSCAGADIDSKSIWMVLGEKKGHPRQMASVPGREIIWRRMARRQRAEDRHLNSVEAEHPRISITRDRQYTHNAYADTQSEGDYHRVYMADQASIEEHQNQRRRCKGP